MIGVIADLAERDAVREFFELFKTPWEYYRPNRHYDVLICAGEVRFDAAPKLLLFYAGRNTRFDLEKGIETAPQRSDECFLSYRGSRIPIYGQSIFFREQGKSLLQDEESGEVAGYFDDSGKPLLARIGYDLFAEVRTLLTVGQPPSNASMPTLELHIALLRDLITAAGLPLVEIPPVPPGYRFIVCLTHDVDHPSIRNHKWDHTMFGFLYRAIFGSLQKVIAGKMPLADLLANWGAALRLPFVYSGLAKDFWRDFADRYLELEKGIASTFFVVPFSNRPGIKSPGSSAPAPALRATCYGAEDIADAIHKLIASGCEVGLHAIDAWTDTSRGREEINKLQQVTGVAAIGVRAHWLYFDPQSPAVFETAGAAYDSTMGYNQTVGYRAGTTQVYKPLAAARLLELPLHVMDTALFYPAYLRLSPKQAHLLLRKMADNTERFGGVLTINWHDRSLAPERLWGQSYRDLLHELKERSAWFATAAQATSWFAKRRSAAFDADPAAPGAPRVKLAPEPAGNLPALCLRTYTSRERAEAAASPAAAYSDIVINEVADTGVHSEARQ